MSTRIPSSLKWLINKRSRLDGKIQKAQKLIEEANRLTKELPKLLADMEAIDRALQMHEIPVDPENIRAVCSHRYRIDLPHGELTRTLLSCLGANPGTSLSTDDLTLLLIERFPNLQSKAKSFIELSRLRTSVRSRLKTLAAENIITRLPAQLSSGVGQWTITN